MPLTGGSGIESPRRLAEAYALLAERPLRPVAGATDVLVQAGGNLESWPEPLLDIWQLDELRGIDRDGDALVLGALTTYTDLRRSRLVATLLPALAEAAATIGAAQIQNRGTLGGNIVNASPAGDTLPLLLVTDAAIVLGSATGERSIPATDFWTGYRQTVRRPDELVVRVRIPLPEGRRLRFRKVGTRRAQAISKVVLAAAWRVAGDGRWRDVRVALGSVAERPIRAFATERVLTGVEPDMATVDRAATVLAEEIRPIDDVRSTSVYRRSVAGRILRRLIAVESGWES